MGNEYTIREARVQVAPGVVLVAEVGSVEGARKLVKDLNAAGFVAKEKTRGEQPLETAPPKTPMESANSRMEVRAGLAKGVLAANNIVGFKGDRPQLLKPGVFKAASDGLLVLLYAVEGGLQQTSVEYEWFRELYEAQNIKSGSPLTMILRNLRNRGYLDKKVYAEGRKVLLTAKGEKKAESVLKELTAAA